MAKDDSRVEITYRSADVQPPLFVAGSFSSPPWTPVEMQHRQTAGGEHVFTQTIHVKPGTAVQYKFRVGSGDWWLLDESAPTVTDDLGNRNNLLHVADRAIPIPNTPPTPPPDSPTLPLATSIRPPELRVVAPTSASSAAAGSAVQGPAPAHAPLSGASTPGFVRTTMEVAETAAQLDPRTPEPAVSDAEAGRIGLRRLSSTPIPDVANTAAAVADTAAALDQDDEYLDVEIGPEFPHENPGEVDNGQDVAPVFAYEFAGAYGRPPSTTESDFSPEPFPLADRDDVQAFDPEDPTLERFPSNREEILERVRTLETGLDEDTPMFDGYPASPIVSPGRKSSFDLAGDFFVMSPTVTSARSQPITWHTESLKRSASRDSPAPDASPTPSLQCIMEEAPLDDVACPVLMKPAKALALSPSISPTTAADGPAVAPLAPAIVVHEAQAVAVDGAREAKNAQGAGEAASSDHDPASAPGAFPPAASPDGPPESEEHGERSLAAAPDDSTGQAPSPAAASLPLALEPAKNQGWVQAFVRLVLVDWLGGLLGRVFGRRRPAPA